MNAIGSLLTIGIIIAEKAIPPFLVLLLCEILETGLDIVFKSVDIVMYSVKGGDNDVRFTLHIRFKDVFSSLIPFLKHVKLQL